MLGLFLPPRLVESRVVIRGIVSDNHHPSPGATAGLAELAEKLKKAKPIEFAGLRAKHKAPLPQAHGSKIPYPFASRSMQVPAESTSGSYAQLLMSLCLVAKSSPTF